MLWWAFIFQNTACLKNNQKSLLMGSLPYTAWNTDVDLGPPVSNSGAGFPEDRLIKISYNALQSTLFETGCPETEVRVPRNLENNFSNDRVTVAVLTDRPDCTGLLLEGSWASSVFLFNYFICFTITWFASYVIQLLSVFLSGFST